MANAREVARKAVKESVELDTWKSNWAFIGKLIEQIKGHSVVTHPMKEALEQGKIDLMQVRTLQLEFRHLIAQPFPEALLRAMHLARELEERLSPRAMVSSRFLLQLNLLDELGFEPGDGDYAGTPEKSHYIKFTDVMDQFGFSPEEIKNYDPTPQAKALRNALEGAYDDLAKLVALLATIETLTPSLLPAFDEGVKKTGAVKTEYFSQHFDGEHALDDDHADDLWWGLAQAMTPERHSEIEKTVMSYVDTVGGFVDTLRTADAAE